MVQSKSPDAMHCCSRSCLLRVADHLLGGSMVSSVAGSTHAVSYGSGSGGTWPATPKASLHTTFETGKNIGVSAGTVQVRSTFLLPPAPAKKNTPGTYSPSHCAVFV